jgi:hypothetical protein
VPKTNIKVRAGDDLGTTSGTPQAHDFDFAVGIAQTSSGGEWMTVCPFSVFKDPLKTQLMDLLGPKNGSPQPGYQCDVAYQKF